MSENHDLYRLFANAHKKIRLSASNVGAHRITNEALAVVEESGERFCEAEVYRVKGELLLGRNGESQKPTGEAEAEACFVKARRVAQGQEAKLWELRAALSLSRLWQHQGKLAQAQKLLSDVLEWFTEGEDTVDVQGARAFLGQGASVQ